MLDQKAKVIEEYKAKMEQANEESSDKFDQLSAKHKEEFDRFRAKWQDPEFLKQFNRPSPRLLSLRDMEKKMALAKRYADAKVVKQKADRQQEEEEAAMQRVIENTMRREFVKMREQQRKEVEAMERHSDKMMQDMERQRKKEIGTLNITMTKLMEVKKNKSPNWRFHTVPRSLVKMRTDARADKGPLSPRTTEKMIKYRDETSAELKIAPVDDSRLNRQIAISKHRAKRTSLPHL